MLYLCLTKYINFLGNCFKSLGYVVNHALFANFHILLLIPSFIYHFPLLSNHYPLPTTYSHYPLPLPTPITHYPLPLPTPHFPLPIRQWLATAPTAQKRDSYS